MSVLPGEMQPRRVPNAILRPKRHEEFVRNKICSNVEEHMLDAEKIVRWECKRAGYELVESPKSREEKR